MEHPNKALFPQNAHVWLVPKASDYLCPSLTSTPEIFRACIHVALPQKDWAPRPAASCCALGLELVKNSSSIGYSPVGPTV